LKFGNYGKIKNAEFAKKPKNLEITEKCAKNAEIADKNAQKGVQIEVNRGNCEK
jgi:hypothetical protein